MGSDKRAAHHPGKVKNRPAYCFTAIFYLTLRQKIAPPHVLGVDNKELATFRDGTLQALSVMFNCCCLFVATIQKNLIIFAITFSVY